MRIPQPFSFPAQKSGPWLPYKKYGETQGPLIASLSAYVFMERETGFERLHKYLARLRLLEQIKLITNSYANLQRVLSPTEFSMIQQNKSIVESVRVQVGSPSRTKLGTYGKKEYLCNGPAGDRVHRSARLVGTSNSALLLNDRKWRVAPL